MKDESKSKTQLITELAELRARNVELEASETGRKQAEEKLRQRVAEIEAMFQAYPDLSFRLDSDGTILDFHAGQASDLYVTPDMFLGRPMQDVIPPDVSRDFLQAFGRAAEGATASLEYSLSLPDGEKIFEARVTSLLEDNVYMVVRDITERKQAEEELRRQAQIVSNSSDMMALLDTDFVYLSANQAYLKMLEKSSDEVVGHSVPELFGEKFFHKVIKPHADRCLSGEDVHYERFFDFSNVRRFMDITYFPYLGEDGEIKGFVANARDITEQKQAEEKRLELEAQLHQAQKHEALGTLAGGVAHDFNNLLQGILGNVDLAMWDLPSGSEAFASLEQAVSGCKRATELVNQILAFSRKTQATRSRVRLQVVLDEVLKLLRPALPTTIEIQCHTDGEVGPVLAIPTQLHQVIMNLAANASHAMRGADGGLLELRLEEVTVDEALMEKTGLSPGGYACLTVSDTGRGMSAETLKHIFEPYFTTKEVGEGSGLGLATAYGIVKNHGGAINVESEEGIGSRFAVLLPLVDRKSTIAPEQIALELAPKGSERIMFIDDEAGIVAVMKLGLERLGYVVEAHVNGVEALAAFRAAPERYDVVVTDQTMPKMTGKVLAEEMLAIRPDCLVILCTGFSEAIDEEHAQSMGIADYIEKPIMVRDLAQIIRNVLASRTDPKQKAYTTDMPVV